MHNKRQEEYYLGLSNRAKTSHLLREKPNQNYFDRSSIDENKCHEKDP